ncbi:hypothetical protein AEM42_02505 [Betaproteobacteria bacterium UKL13-2]|jgi:hypothetical protein|nr:hypothetical protein AEM42_02505 [Betaproteobacteria bacterium UKL13-2]
MIAVAIGSGGFRTRSNFQWMANIAAMLRASQPLCRFADSGLTVAYITRLANAANPHRLKR